MKDSKQKLEIPYNALRGFLANYTITDRTASLLTTAIVDSGAGKVRDEPGFMEKGC